MYMVALLLLFSRLAHTSISIQNNIQIFEESKVGSFDSGTIDCSSGADCFIDCDVSCYDLTVEAGTSRSLTLRCSAERACDFITILHGPSDTMRVLCDGTYACDQITIYSGQETAFIDVQCNGENSCDKALLDIHDAVQLNVSCTAPASCYRNVYELDAVDTFGLFGYAERTSINMTQTALDAIDMVCDPQSCDDVTVYCGHRSGHGTPLSYDNETDIIKCSNSICCPRTLRAPNVYRCNDDEPCVVECTEALCEFESLIDASKASSLSLRCENDSLCQFLEVICPSNGECDIECSAPYSCQYVIIGSNVSSSTSVSVRCDAEYSCQYLRVDVAVIESANIACTASFACDQSEILIVGQSDTRVVVTALQTQSLSDAMLNVSHASLVDVVCSGATTCAWSEFVFDDVTLVRTLCDDSETACLAIDVTVNMRSNNDSIIVSSDNTLALQTATINTICTAHHLWITECAPNITLVCDSLSAYHSQLQYASDSCTQCSLDYAHSLNLSLTSDADITHSYAYDRFYGWTSTLLCSPNMDDETSAQFSVLEFFSEPIFLIGAPILLVCLVLLVVCSLYRCKKNSEQHKPSKLSARSVETPAIVPDHESNVIMNAIEKISSHHNDEVMVDDADDHTHLSSHHRSRPPYVAYELNASPSLAPTEFDHDHPHHQVNASISSFQTNMVTSQESAVTKQQQHSNRDRKQKLRQLSVSSVDSNITAASYFSHDLPEYAQNDDAQKDDARKLRKWLKYTVKLPQYYGLFLEHGYKSLEHIRSIDTDGKIMLLGINSKTHRTQLLIQIQLLNEIGDGQFIGKKQPSIGKKHSQSRTESEHHRQQRKDEHEQFRRWLKHKVKLPKYYDQFVSHKYDSLDLIAADIEDETRLIEMGITSQTDRNVLLREIAMLSAKNKHEREIHPDLSKKRKSKRHRSSKKTSKRKDVGTDDQVVNISIPRKSKKPPQLQALQQEDDRHNESLKDRLPNILGGGREKTNEQNRGYLENADNTQLVGPSSIEMPVHVLIE